ncbi:hypothetical protein D0N87_30655, partial [Pseudomonas sp. ATCC 13867]
PMETQIPLGGRLYTFETDTATQRTALKLKADSTPAQSKQPKIATDAIGLVGHRVQRPAAVRTDAKSG